MGRTPNRSPGPTTPTKASEPTERTDLTGRILEVVASVPAGTVISYGEVAAAAGRPGAARAVGTVLRRHGRHVPWWRVVTATGRLAPGIEREQARRLNAEGVACRSGFAER